MLSSFQHFWATLEDHLFSVPSTHELFNPYRDRHPELDGPGAAAQRRANLRSYLASYRERPRLFLLVEAPGPWGCRFSGVPITSEEQLTDAHFPLEGEVSSEAEAPHGEYSANIFWRVLEPFFPHFFVWNSVPLHPHDAEEPLTIRTPRRSELKTYAPLAEAALQATEPDRVLAVGRKAEYVLDHLGRECTYVRHPSQGGAKRFEAGVLEACGALDLPASDSAT